MIYQKRFRKNNISQFYFIDKNFVFIENDLLKNYKRKKTYIALDYKNNFRKKFLWFSDVMEKNDMIFIGAF